MSRVNKKIAALAVLFGLEFLFVGLFTNGTVSRTNQYIPPPPKDVLHTDVRVTAKTNGGFVLESYGEPIPQSEVFLTAKENSGMFVRSSVVGPLFSRVIVTPKVPRYIAKSVLNL